MNVVSQVAEEKSKMTPAALAYINLNQDHEQFMACAGEMHGESTQSPAESMNKANNSARAMNLYGKLQHTHECHAYLPLQHFSLSHWHHC